MADADLEVLTDLMACGLPPEEPISKWLAGDREQPLRLRVGGHALLMCDGLVEYHVDPRTGAVQVLDHREPRSMRAQRY